jgi:methionine-rich copper-binding protein CopC
MNTPIVDSSLHIKDIISKDLNSISLVFGEKVQVDTVKVKIVKQSDNSSVDVGEVTAENDAKMIDTLKITFTNDLEGSTSYKLTVISATSES